jgi:hypothetical protein
MVSGAPAGIQAARNTPSNQVIFGTMGSKTANYTPDQRRVMDELERQGMDTENLFLHGTSDDIRQPTSSRTGSRDSGFIGKGFYGATPEGSRIADYYANTAAPKFRNEAGEYSEPNVFPYITRRGNYKQYSLADKQALSKQARQDEFFGQDLAKKNIDEGFIGAEVVDADGNIIERVNYFPDTDTRSALNYDTTDLYSGGGRQGTAIAGGSALRGLDKSASARMQRAQDLEFDTSRPLYHYTDKLENGREITSLQPSPADAQTKLGRGIYTSPKTQYGDRYVRQEKDIAEGYNENARAIPVYARGKLATGDEYEAAYKSAQESLGIQRGVVDTETKLKARNNIQNEAQRILKDQGFTGVQFMDEVMIFDPKDVRSINAEFDPTKADSADLLSSRQSERQMSALRGIA